MKSKSLFSFIVTLFLIYGCSSNRQADGKSNILAKNDINGATSKIILTVAELKAQLLFMTLEMINGLYRTQLD